MDFTPWNPTHTILVLFAIVAFIGHVAVMFYRIGQNGKKIDKQSEAFFHALERFEERVDKRFVEVNQQIAGIRNEIAGIRNEIAGIRDEMNQGFSDIRSEMNQRFSDMQTEMSKLNQNHIDHLIHHEREDS